MESDCMYTKNDGDGGKVELPQEIIDRLLIIEISPNELLERGEEASEEDNKEFDKKFCWDMLEYFEQIYLETKEQAQKQEDMEVGIELENYELTNKELTKIVNLFIMKVNKLDEDKNAAQKLIEYQTKEIEDLKRKNDDLETSQKYIIEELSARGYTNTKEGRLKTVKEIIEDKKLKITLDRKKNFEENKKEAIKQQKQRNKQAKESKLLSKEETLKRNGGEDGYPTNQHTKSKCPQKGLDLVIHSASAPSEYNGYTITLDPKYGDENKRPFYRRWECMIDTTKKYRAYRIIRNENGKSESFQSFYKRMKARGLTLTYEQIINANQGKEGMKNPTRPIRDCNGKIFVKPVKLSNEIWKSNQNQILEFHYVITNEEIESRYELAEQRDKIHFEIDWKDYKDCIKIDNKRLLPSSKWLTTRLSNYKTIEDMDTDTNIGVIENFIQE